MREIRPRLHWEDRTGGGRLLAAAGFSYAGVCFFPDLLPEGMNGFSHSVLHLAVLAVFMVVYLKGSSFSISPYSYVLGAAYSFCLLAGKAISDTGILPLRTWKFWGVWAVFGILAAHGLEWGYCCIADACSRTVRSGRSRLKIKRRWIWAGIFLAWLPVWLALYPGAFAYDAEFAYEQIRTGALTSHHPVQQMAKVYNQGGDLLSDEKKMLFEILPQERLEYNYEPRLADPMNGALQMEALSDAPLKYINLWLRIGIKNPVIYISSVPENTIAYWYPCSFVDGYTRYYRKHRPIEYELYRESSYFAPITEPPGRRKSKIPVYLLTVLTFLYFQGSAICLTLKYVSFSLVFALISKLQGKDFVIQFSLLNSFPQPYPRV